MASGSSRCGSWPEVMPENAFLVVGVIESGSADAHADVGGAVAGTGGGEDATLGAEDDQRFAIGHVVAGEVGGGILLGKFGLAAMQLLFHGGEEEIVGRSGRQAVCGVQRFLTKDGNQNRRRKMRKICGNKRSFRISSEWRVYRSREKQKKRPLSRPPFSKRLMAGIRGN